MNVGDLVIADAAGPRSGEFVLVDAVTRQTIAGPFDSIRDAVRAGCARRERAAIWREFVDERGRAFGPPLRLPIKPF
jgi:hypothetical protein